MMFFLTFFICDDQYLCYVCDLVFRSVRVSLSTRTRSPSFGEPSRNPTAAVADFLLSLFVRDTLESDCLMRKLKNGSLFGGFPSGV